jgi:hypothetical protein
MMRHLLTPIGLALALTAAPAASRVAAQSSTTSVDSTTTSNDSSDTYVTDDGYGLGTIVNGSIQDVTTRTKVAMIRMKIVQEPAPRLGGGWRTFQGKKGDLDVSIRLRRQSASRTRVEVNARAGLTGWDKGLAQQVLDEIGKR